MGARLEMVSRRVHLASRLRSVNSAFPRAVALKFGFPFELGHARTNREPLVGAGELGKPRAGRLWPLMDRRSEVLPGRTRSTCSLGHRALLLQFGRTNPTA